MSDAWNFLEKGTVKVAKAFGDVTGIKILEKGARAGLNRPAQTPKPPGIPTLDTAAQNQQVTDRIRMRRGVLKTIYGGGSSNAAAPATATKTLLGS